MDQWKERAQRELNEVGVPLLHPQAYARMHAYYAQKELKEPGENAIERLVIDQREDLSRRLARSTIQEGCAARNILLVRQLVNLLVNDGGQLEEERLERSIQAFKRHLYCLGPRRRYDGVRRTHILRVLHCIQSSATIKRMLNRITKPFANPTADQLIRDTLGLPSGTRVTDADTTRAVLSAWMTYLRQNVGSCFATAPAILVQREQPQRLLKDLQDLLNSGQMSRTVRGVTYSVPLSASWGAGDLRKPLLLSASPRNSPVKLDFSPGLHSALSALGLLDAGLNEKAKVSATRGLLKAALEALSEGQAFFYATCEEILRYLIFQKAELSEQDYQDYHNRPKVILSDGAIAGEQKDAPIGKRVEQVDQDIQRAASAFKALTDNALLKAWEFSLASFAETKLQLTQWNLYSSLGMAPDDEEGIGQRLYGIVKERMEEANAEVHRQQEYYDQIYYQVRHLEQRLKRAQDDSQARWLRAEYQNQRNEASTHLELRDRAHYRAQKLSHLYEFLIDVYLDKFRGYFQEVYDADIRDVRSGPYDDSPAGFRLLCKHGRSNIAQWTMIHGPDEFVNNLAAFFITVEPEIAADPFMQGLEDDFAFITTNMVTHVKTDSFIHGAFRRMAAKYGTPLPDNPLDNLDKVKAKPWVYTSGGNLHSLVQCYFGGEDKPEGKEKWVEAPDELLAFMIEVIRHVPRRTLEEYQEGQRDYFLVHSPTHAFLLTPGTELFQEALRSPTYTYTWIKNYVTLDTQSFQRDLRLDVDMIQVLVDALSKQLPHDRRKPFRGALGRLPAQMRLVEFREWIVEVVERSPALSGGGFSVLQPGQVDSVLYSHCPFIRAYQLEDSLKAIFEHLPGLDSQTLKELYQALDIWTRGLGRHSVLSSKQLRQICLTLLMMIHGQTSVELDYHWEVTQVMRRLKMAFPAPFIFADTNWMTHHFAFVVNPGTGQLDLWRTDYTGVVGEPMSHWQPWLDGSRQHPKWGILHRPEQYR